MIYQSCSIDEVIGKVIRHTRVKDTAFIIDMHEWIPECMRLMNTHMQYVPDYKDVEIKFHKGKLPCGLVFIEAVEWCGARLRYGNSVKHPQAPDCDTDVEQINGAFVSIPYKAGTANSTYSFSSDIKSVYKLPACSNQWYQVELGRILTSFEEGWVRIFFRKTPTDARGLPLIPDNENYKQALYWYTRACMIGAGFEDRIFGWDQCNQNYEFYAARAVTEIDFPSPDEMETRLNTQLRLIFPQDYFDNFFSMTSGEGTIEL